MSRLYSYIFGNRQQQEMESRLQLMEKKLEEAEIMGRYRDAKLIALLDRIENLEAEFRRHKTASLQQTTALEEQLVHARQTAQPLAALKLTDCISPARLGQGSNISAACLEEPFLKNKLKAILEAYGQPAPPDASLYRCDTMCRIHDSEELGISATDMYMSNEKGQMAYCLCGGIFPRGPTAALRALLGTLKVRLPEKTG